jgi:hypothetical protein
MLNLGGWDGNLADFSGRVLILKQKGDEKSSFVSTKDDKGSLRCFSDG